VTSKTVWFFGPPCTNESGQPPPIKIVEPCLVAVIYRVQCPVSCTRLRRSRVTHPHRRGKKSIIKMVRKTKNASLG